MNVCCIITVDNVFNTPEPPSNFTKEAWLKIYSKMPTHIDTTQLPPIYHDKADDPYLSLYVQNRERD